MLKNIENILSQIYIPTMNLFDIIEVLIVIALVYNIWKNIKDTRALIILKGIILLLFCYIIAYICSFGAILLIFQSIATVLAMILVIVFQSEIRKFIENFGSRNHLFILKNNNKNKIEKISENTINQIIDACKELSKTKTGALIVIENAIPLNDVIETGITLNSDTSSQLLINIFEKNTPLHDGAVIIQDNKVASATCYLPLSENNNINKNYGTRHRAALGISETTDAIVVVVSEETGHISIAEKGKIKSHLKEDDLRKRLTAFKESTDITITPSLKTLFTKNISKKVISLVLGFIIWVTLINISDPIISKTFNNVPITIVNESAINEINKTYVLDSDDLVDVTVRCNRSNLEKISLKDIVVYADFNKLSDVYSVSLKCEIKSIANAETQLSEDSLKISLEDLVETEYKIQTEVKGTPSENSFVYDIALDSDTLSIKGAKSLIETIDKVVVEVNVDDVSANKKFSYKPSVYDKNGALLSSEKLTLSTENIDGIIKTYKTKKVPINIKLLPQDELTKSLIKDYNIDQKFVNIAANNEKLNQINSFDIDVPLTITIEQAITDNFSKNILFSDFIKDEGVFLTDLSANCNISINFNQTNIRRTLKVPTNSINILNLKPNDKVSYNDDFIEIVCEGTKEQILNLSNEDLSLSINADSLYRGTNRAKVIISTNKKVKIPEQTLVVIVSAK